MGSELQLYGSQRKLAEWSERVASCRSSGKKVKEWCEENGVSPGSYYRWQKILFEMAAAERSRSGSEMQFAEVPISKKTAPTAIIHLGNAEVEIFSGIDETTLQTICRVLHYAE